MAFIEGTQIFTYGGFKNIEDISGRDKVLVRNFLGDAEFIQPFALKKKQYDGGVIKIGAKNWSFSVTPDHDIVHDRSRRGRESNFMLTTAAEFKIHKDDRIYRKFRYMFAEEPKKESIYIRDEFGIRYVSISHQDWYRLVGYVLMRGFIRMKPGKPMLFLFLEEGRIEEETLILGDILDRLGVGWHVQYSDKTTPKIVVSSKNTLASRLINRLGSKKRKDMFLPDKMIYNSTKELGKLLIEAIIDASIKPTTARRVFFQIATTNIALIESLTKLGTLVGYSISHALRAKAGTKIPKGVTKKDTYVMRIGNPVETYSPKYKKKSTYSGHVYEIDLFDGQVYVKEGSMPVWVNPK